MAEELWFQGYRVEEWQGEGMYILYAEYRWVRASTLEELEDAARGHCSVEFLREDMVGARS